MRILLFLDQSPSFKENKSGIPTLNRAGHSISVLTEPEFKVIGLANVVPAAVEL